VRYGSGESLEPFSKCGGCLLSRDLCPCLNPKEFTLFGYSQECASPTSFVLLLITFQLCLKQKKKAGLPVKLQPGSIDWLSAFAKRKTFCSSMSFPPASKKIAFYPLREPWCSSKKGEVRANSARLQSRKRSSTWGRKRRVFFWAGEMLWET